MSPKNHDSNRTAQTRIPINDDQSDDEPLDNIQQMPTRAAGISQVHSAASVSKRNKRDRRKRSILALPSAQVYGIGVEAGQGIVMHSFAGKAPNKRLHKNARNFGLRLRLGESDPEQEITRFQTEGSQTNANVAAGSAQTGLLSGATELLDELVVTVFDVAHVTLPLNRSGITTVMSRSERQKYFKGIKQRDYSNKHGGGTGVSGQDPTSNARSSAQTCMYECRLSIFKLGGDSESSTSQATTSRRAWMKLAGSIGKPSNSQGDHHLHNRRSDRKRQWQTTDAVPGGDTARWNQPLVFRHVKKDNMLLSETWGYELTLHVTPMDPDTIADGETGAVVHTAKSSGTLRELFNKDCRVDLLSSDSGQQWSCQMRLQGAWKKRGRDPCAHLWSVPVPITSVGEYFLPLFGPWACLDAEKRRQLEDYRTPMVRVSVEAVPDGHGTVAVSVSDATATPPFKVENRTTQLTLGYWERGAKDTTYVTIDPGEWRSFAWANPLGREKRLCVQVHRVEGTHVSHAGIVNYDIEAVGKPMPSIVVVRAAGSNTSAAAEWRAVAVSAGGSAWTEVSSAAAAGLAAGSDKVRSKMAASISAAKRGVRRSSTDAPLSALLPKFTSTPADQGKERTKQPSDNSSRPKGLSAAAQRMGGGMHHLAEAGMRLFGLGSVDAADSLTVQARVYLEGCTRVLSFSVIGTTGTTTQTEHVACTKQLSRKGPRPRVMNLISPRRLRRLSTAGGSSTSVWRDRGSSAHTSEVVATSEGQTNKSQMSFHELDLLCDDSTKLSNTSDVTQVGEHGVVAEARHKKTWSKSCELNVLWAGVNVVLLNNKPEEILEVGVLDVQVTSPLGTAELTLAVRHVEVNDLSKYAVDPIVLSPLRSLKATPAKQRHQPRQHRAADESDSSSSSGSDDDDGDDDIRPVGVEPQDQSTHGSDRSTTGDQPSDSWTQSGAEVSTQGVSVTPGNVVNVKHSRTAILKSNCEKFLVLRTWWFASGQCIVIPKLALRVASLDAYVEMGFLIRLSEFVQQCNEPVPNVTGGGGDERATITNHHLNIPNNDLVVDPSSNENTSLGGGGGGDTKVRNGAQVLRGFAHMPEHLVLSGNPESGRADRILVSLESFTMTPMVLSLKLDTARHPGGLAQLLGGVHWSSSLEAVAQINPTLSFRKMTVTHELGYAHDLVALIASKYARSAVKQLHQVLLSMDLVGDPIGHWRDIRTELHELRHGNHPLTSLRRLIVASVSASFGTVGQSATSLEHALQAVSGYELPSHEDEVCKTTTDLFVKGARRSVLNVWNGVSGVVVLPVRALRRGQGVKGAMAGAVKGIAGTILMPVVVAAGGLGQLSQTVESSIHLWGSHTVRVPMRPRRELANKYDVLHTINRSNIVTQLELELCGLGRLGMRGGELLLRFKLLVRRKRRDETEEEGEERNNKTNKKGKTGEGNSHAGWGLAKWNKTAVTPASLPTQMVGNGDNKSKNDGYVLEQKVDYVVELLDTEAEARARTKGCVPFLWGHSRSIKDTEQSHEEQATCEYMFESSINAGFNFFKLSLHDGGNRRTGMSLNQPRVALELIERTRRHGMSHFRHLGNVSFSTDDIVARFDQVPASPFKGQQKHANLAAPAASKLAERCSLDVLDGATTATATATAGDIALSKEEPACERYELHDAQQAGAFVLLRGKYHKFRRGL